MIIDTLNIPCPHCMADLEGALLTVPAEALAAGRSVFCPHRYIALTAWVTRGRLVWWQMWPAASAEELRTALAGAEAAMTLAAASELSQRAPRH